MNVGEQIPEILGIDQDGREIKRSDYQGRKLILYSYPKANTSGCTAEACSLQAHKAELEAGTQAALWNDNFDFDLTLIAERSEPTWI